MTFVAQEFFNYMFNENLAEKCRYVVLRITNPGESHGHSSRRRSRRSNPQEKVDPETIMRLYGLEREKIKAKVCKFINIKYIGFKETLILYSTLFQLILFPVPLKTTLKVYLS